MRKPAPAFRRWSVLSAAVLCLAASGNHARAQIPAPVTTGVPNYRTSGTTDQPFDVEVLDARRTVQNTLLLRVALTNRGKELLAIKYDFAGNSNPAELARVSALYVVDPNGRKKYEVLRDAGGSALCSRVDPPLAPGERRVLFAQLAALPATTSSFDVYFPKATPVLNVPVGLPQAGEPIPAEASVGGPGAFPAPATAVPPAPPASIDQPTSNNQPNVYTNQTNLVPGGTPGRAIGSIQSNNSTVPFTLDVLGLRAAAGQRATLRIAFINNGSGLLDAAGQFNGTAGALTDARSISGVYLVDPASKQRFEVVRETQTNALCTVVDPPFSAGERRVLEATFPPLPEGVKSVYVYFPHASPIAGVPLDR